MRQKSEGLSRRGFIGAVGVAAAGAAVAAPVAQAAFPRGSERIAGAPLPSDSRDAARAWYDATLDRIVRAWEPRFRFRQYRPAEEGDWEDNYRPPIDELSYALALTLGLPDDFARSALIVAVAPGVEETYDDGAQMWSSAADAMAHDALTLAGALGYFATSCPDALRFPDLPEFDHRADDFERTERELESARNCAVMWGNIADMEAGRGRPAPEAVQKAAEFRDAAEKLEARLTGMRAGTIPALTRRQKVEAWRAETAAIVMDYRRRLEAAGVEASWVEVPSSWWLREDKEALS